MGLRTKIILPALILVFLIGILLFVYFPYLVLKDVSSSVVAVTESVEDKLAEFVREDKSWTKEEVVGHIQEIREAIPQGFTAFKEQLARQILLQLVAIVLVILFFIALLIWRINREIISPIVMLSKATGEVREGHYEEAVLPSVGKRGDEIATLTRSFQEMVVGLKERENIRSVLDKVVSKDVAAEILKTTPHLGGEDRFVTMLFSDIRGFTTLTQDLTPQKTIEILNLYMTKMSRVIENEGGIIDKYVGDEIMALFGAPVEHPHHALRAISTGMLMLETIKLLNASRKEAKEPYFEMGIGIHSGLVVAGNMGAEDRLNYTVLGRNVNLAARLCQGAKPGQLIISEHTLKEPLVESSFVVKPLEPISLKGFVEPVAVYEIVGFKWEKE